MRLGVWGRNWWLEGEQYDNESSLLMAVQSPVPVLAVPLWRPLRIRSVPVGNHVHTWAICLILISLHREAIIIQLFMFCLRGWPLSQASVAQSRNGQFGRLSEMDQVFVYYVDEGLQRFPSPCKIHPTVSLLTCATQRGYHARELHHDRVGAPQGRDD